jgi:hypothetical protein
MKSLIFTLALITSFVSYSQKLEIDKETGKYTISGISEVKTMNKQEIFDAIYKYVVLNFSKVENVIIQTNGKVYSIFADVSRPSTLFSGTNFVRFSMLIEIKDEKFRYTFRNFAFNTNEFELKSFIGKEAILEDTEFFIGSLIIRLGMACKSNEDW